MKRLAALFCVLGFVAFWTWYAIPAGANTIPRIDIECDQVSFTWTNFPERPVDLTVTLEQHSRTFSTTVSTEGARSGEATVPANFDDGPAHADVSWTLQKPHHISADAVLECSETTTTTAAETTTSTTSPTTSSSGFPTSTGSSSVTTAPPGLPNTGSGASLWALGIGLYATALGAAFMALNRRGTA